jgi:hypothetical protein
VRELVEGVADGQVALHRDGHREVDAAGEADLEPILLIRCQSYDRKNLQRCKYIA